MGCVCGEVEAVDVLRVWKGFIGFEERFADGQDTRVVGGDGRDVGAVCGDFEFGVVDGVVSVGY